MRETMTREDVLREFDAPTSSLHTQQMADEIVRLREALAAAPRVTEGAWSVSRWHVANRGGWIKLDGTTRTNLPQYTKERAEQLAAWWDSVEPNGAPHRVVRVALVDDDAPAAAGREDDADHWLIERQAALLTGVVNAIRGEPAPLSKHSHHDAVELVQGVVAKLYAAKPVPESGGYVCDTNGVIDANVVSTIGETVYNHDQAMGALASLLRSHEALRTIAEAAAGREVTEAEELLAMQEVAFAVVSEKAEQRYPIPAAVVEAGARTLNAMWRGTARDGDQYAEFDECEEAGRDVWRLLAKPVIEDALRALAAERGREG